MAEANITMASADEIRATGLFTEAQIQAGIQDEGGYVGEAVIEKVGTVQYFITKKGSARIPDQMGDRSE